MVKFNSLENDKYFSIFLFVFGMIFITISVNKGINLERKLEFFDIRNNSKRSIVLLGDSIFKNDMYVLKSKSVNDLLENKFLGNVYNLAENNSKILDIYTQMQLIPKTLNHETTYIFISVGGNDILERYVYENTNTDNTLSLYKMFNHYKIMIQHLINMFPKAKIVLANIYYPKSSKYQAYLDIKKKWNDLLYQLAADPINKITDILTLSTIMIDINDFALSIEPSEEGSIKIVKGILDIVESFS